MFEGEEGAAASAPLSLPDLNCTFRGSEILNGEQRERFGGSDVHGKYAISFVLIREQFR